MSLVLDDVGSGYNLSKINSNFQKLEDFANDGAISEDNNVMTTYLDMNSNRIVNVADAVNDSDAVAFSQIRYIVDSYQAIDDNVQATIDNANASAVSASEASASVVAAEAIYDQTVVLAEDAAMSASEAEQALANTIDFIGDLPSTVVTDIQAASIAVGSESIIYTTDTTSAIPSYLYSGDDSITYVVPSDAVGKTISSVAGNQLTTTDSSIYTLGKVGSLSIVENYLKPNQNMNVPYGDAVLPNAVAEDYTAGDVFAYDYEAVTNIVGLTRTGGITSGTSGTYMRSYKGDFSSSFFGVQLADGTVSQTGVDIDYNVRKAGYTTVAIDIASAPDHYCVALSPAEGRVAVINDEESRFYVRPDTGMIEILPIGQYSSGTSSYPDGLSESDFIEIRLYGGNSSGDIQNAAIMDESMIDAGWATLTSYTASSTFSRITRVDESSFSFSRVGSGVVMKIVGILKVGTI